MWMDNWVLNLPKIYWPKYGVHELPFFFRFFETKKDVVVLSSSNNPKTELVIKNCEKYNIPILRRKGGGGTVVLGSGCLILTFAFYAKDVFGNSRYFSKINQFWIDALSSAGIEKLSQNGISDICHGEQKIAGTSIFRKKHLLVYQGSLLVNPNKDLIETLLAHPTREPDYRKGRSHKDFLTSLSALGYSHSTHELALQCQLHFNQNVAHFFAEDALSH